MNDFHTLRIELKLAQQTMVRAISPEAVAEEINHAFAKIQEGDALHRIIEAAVHAEVRRRVSELASMCVMREMSDLRARVEKAAGVAVAAELSRVKP